MREVVGIYLIKGCGFRLSMLLWARAWVHRHYVPRGYFAGTYTAPVILTTRPIIDKSETSRYACTTAAVKGSTQQD